MRLCPVFSFPTDFRAGPAAELWLSQKLGLPVGFHPELWLPEPLLAGRKSAGGTGQVTGRLLGCSFGHPKEGRASVPVLLSGLPEPVPNPLARGGSCPNRCKMEGPGAVVEERINKCSSPLREAVHRDPLPKGISCGSAGPPQLWISQVRAGLAVCAGHLRQAVAQRRSGAWVPPGRPGSFAGVALSGVGVILGDAWGEPVPWPGL